MKLLEERIAREGKVLPGNVVKVDGFLNHRVDAAFLGKLADEFIAHFDINGLTAVMTVEASGIPLATVCAEKMGVPMIFAKKAKSDNIEGGLFKSEIMSYTYKKKVTLIVSAEWLHPGDRSSMILWRAAKQCAGLLRSLNRPVRNLSASVLRLKKASRAAAMRCVQEVLIYIRLQ